MAKILAQYPIITLIGLLGTVATLIDIIIPLYSWYFVVSIALAVPSIILITKKYRRLNPFDPDLHQIFPSIKEDYRIEAVRSKEDIEAIVKLAERNYNCPINDFNYKHQMWNKNQNTFWVVKNEAEIVLANIGLLPLKPEIYGQFSNGKITEQEFRPEHIHTESESEEVKYIYIEGLLVEGESNEKVTRAVFKLICRSFDKIVSSLTLNKESCIICAIAGSQAGSSLLEKLNFKKTENKKDRKDKLDFYYVRYKEIKKRLKEI